MTVEYALRVLVDLDNHVVCPRPSVFGEMAHLLRTMAIALDPNVHDAILSPLEFDDFGDLAGLAEDGFWPLPRDAGETWRLD